ncbi:MAG: matrixin family metalloprotease [Comamonadaceae bacterium]|nr:MAG: matrixin family metalloprotease [Comamonadaceae bacterium]
MPTWLTGSRTVRSPISDDYRIAALQDDTGTSEHWNPAVPITYSFPTLFALFAAPYGSGEITDGWQPLSSSQQQAVRKALAEWSNVANIQFVEVTESGPNVGDLRFGFTRDVSADTAAHTYLPFDSSPEAGDVWLGWDWRTDILAPASTSTSTYDIEQRFAYATLIHEIGHALGLGHPFDDGSTRFTDPLPASEDTVLNTVMSYEWYDWADELMPPSSPMPYDILAIQYLYGANTSFQAGDTVWSFDIAQAGVETIWDAGGVDTLRLTNATNMPFPDVDGSQWSLIDLEEGAGSIIGFVNQGDYGLTSTVNGVTVRPYGTTPTIYIAFGAVIENAIGTAGVDLIYGNAHNNRLDGGGDTRRDQIDGDGGLDTAVYSGRLSDYQIQRAAPPANPSDPLLGDIEARKEYTVTRKGTDAALSQDWLVNIERLAFSDRSVALDFDAGEAGAEAVGLVTALLGRQSLSNAALMGEVIHYADHMDAHSMAQILVDAGVTAALAGGSTDSDLVRLLYSNVTGQAPSAAELQWTVAYAEDNGFSQADILAVIAGIPQTFVRADLVGLQQQGLTYIEFA